MVYNVSIIIPCYNEEKTVRNKLENSSTLSNVKEIIVIDDNSTDDTYKIASDFINSYGKQNKPTIILQKNRHTKGKTGAMRTGLEIAEGDLILMTDADVVLKKGCLMQVQKYFIDNKTGAVCFSPKIFSKTGKVTQQYVSLYERFNRFIKIALSGIDSLVIMHGQALIFRNDLNLTPDPNIRADDVDYANMIRRKGFKCKYAKDIYFFEELGNLNNTKEQKARRCQAVMGALRKHNYFLFNPSQGLYGMVCFPTEWFLYFVQPWLFFLLLAIPIIIGIYLKSSIMILLYLTLLALLLLITQIRGIFSLNLICIRSIIGNKSDKYKSRWRTIRH